MKHLTTIIGLLTITSAAAQDNTQSQLRENPNMETAKSKVYVAPGIDYPHYINLRANNIDMNGDDWTGLAAEINHADSSRVTIVHIGDSHLQADMGTAVIRSRLGDHYGSAGRSLIVPFKLAGTNEPVDYTITSSVPMTQARLLKTPWPIEMGFTGIGISPQSNEYDLNIGNGEPFDSLAIYYSGEKPAVLTDSLITNDITPGIMQLKLAAPTTSLSLDMSNGENSVIHGINLINGHTGIAYHVIGNNGATYGTYNGITGFADDISRFDPALIIISLGTNEAFNTTSNEDMRASMKRLIEDLRGSCPQAKLLITTPSECQRRRTRRRRRRASFYVNQNVKRLRDVIVGFARTEGIPCYDFYDVAGGTGSSFKWLRDKYLNTDRIHLTRAGYTLQGHLLTEAIEKALNNSKK
ncbi:MAG: hypothetical protein K2L77_07130 [Muribaculaceae bacterium]|nr:hypothetical protein [Muribaculaceae bacterium]